MAELIEDTTGRSFREFTLKLTDGDRVRIEANGEYVTYMRLVDDELSYLGNETMKVI